MKFVTGRQGYTANKRRDMTNCTPIMSPCAGGIRRRIIDGGDEDEAAGDALLSVKASRRAGEEKHVC